jgi:glycosyltransferase involved in cell wall biosynthesis
MSDLRVVVSDGGSSDATLDIALDTGAVIALGTPGRGQQLARGAKLAMASKTETRWLFFVHADTQLPADWQEMAAEHMARFPTHAAHFRFGGEGSFAMLSVMRFLVRLREVFWSLPYGDQGLLIPVSLYNKLGGYHDMILFEDVDLVTRIRRESGRMKRLRGAVRTDLSAYRREGLFKRGWRNLRLLSAYRHGVPVEELARRYRTKL